MNRSGLKVQIVLSSRLKVIVVKLLLVLLSVFAFTREDGSNQQLRYVS